MGKINRVTASLCAIALVLGAHAWSVSMAPSQVAQSYSCISGDEPACVPPTVAGSAHTTGAIVASVLTSVMTSQGNGAMVDLPGFRPPTSAATASLTHHHRTVAVAKPKAVTHRHTTTRRRSSTAAHAAHRRSSHTRHAPRPAHRRIIRRSRPTPAPASSVPVIPARVTTSASGASFEITDTSSWPSDATTGVPDGTALRKVGTIQADTPGQVIDSVDVTGTINVTAKGVIIRNCRIHATKDPYGVLVYAGGSVRIEDCEFYGQQEAAIAGNNWSALRVNIHDEKSDGLKLGSNCLLADSFVHDFSPAPGAHADGGQMQVGVRHLTITHNTILMGTSKSDNAALMLSPDLGPSETGPVTVTDNLLGGGGITLRIVDGNNGQYHQTGYSVRGNRFVPNAIYQEVRVNEPLAAFHGWADNRLTGPHN